MQYFTILFAQLHVFLSYQQQLFSIRFYFAFIYFLVVFPVSSRLLVASTRFYSYTFRFRFRTEKSKMKFFLRLLTQFFWNFSNVFLITDNVDRHLNFLNLFSPVMLWKIDILKTAKNATLNGHISKARANLN